MEVSEAKSLCILGRQPALGAAELESLFGSDNMVRLDSAALLNVPAGDIDFTRLGGVIKVAKILSFIDSNNWLAIEKYLLENVPGHLTHLPAGQFTLGLSAYGIKTSANQINKTAMRIKKLIRPSGRPVRVVPNKTLVLNSAQVLHNKLTTKGAWELLFVSYGKQTILAQTMFVQDIEAYGARDQARPKRDAYVGMLPPKLAQILINLTAVKPGNVILDPFCGTGVLLQEALIMGFDAIGSDIEPKMVDYSRTNIEWLTNNINVKGKLLALETADATTHRWNAKFDAISSEVYLGKPLKKQASVVEIKDRSIQVEDLLLKFLNNIKTQIKSRSVLTLAVPAWRSQNGKIIDLPALDNLSKLGYTRVALEHVRNDELIYYRPNQYVARRILVLERN